MRDVGATQVLRVENFEQLWLRVMALHGHGSQIARVHVVLWSVSLVGAFHGLGFLA